MDAPGFMAKILLSSAPNCGSATTGMKWPDEERNAIVYPNPAHDRVTFNGVSAREIRIFSAEGWQAEIAASRNSDESNDVSALPSGVYILETILADGTAVRTKLLISR